MKTINVYAPLPKSGALHPKIAEVIEQSLDNDLAKKGVSKVVEHALNALQKTDVYICSYANLSIWFVRAWTVPHFALNYKCRVEFVNQELHDMSESRKLQFIHNHGNIQTRKSYLNSVRSA